MPCRCSATCDPDTYCVTADTVRAALTPRTKAVIAVHLFGNVAPVAEIEALGVPVLEDAAQAAGSRSAAARPGALGTAATFSFFPSKNLGCFGDGGAITTSDPDIAERARTLRFHGSRDKVTYEQVGYNSRLDELQAAILRVQLPLLDAWADGRRRAGALTTSRPASASWSTLPRPVAGSEPAWHLYVIAHPDPPALEAALAAAGIGHKAYYRTPIHRQAAMRAVGRRRRAARDRPRRPHAPGDPDEPGAHRRAGRRGRGRRARRPVLIFLNRTLRVRDGSVGGVRAAQWVKSLVWVKPAQHRPAGYKDFIISDSWLRAAA